jgi:hypothetical protein
VSSNLQTASPGRVPLWLTVETRGVVAKFVAALGRRVGWRVVYLISPWITAFDAGEGVSFSRLLTRLRREGTTTYVATRPPLDAAHDSAIQSLRATGVANVVLIEGLHSKIYLARTDSGSLAMIGSANFTSQSLSNVEVGVLLTDYGDGREVVRNLLCVAQDIYRSPDRMVVCQRRFGRQL